MRTAPRLLLLLAATVGLVAAGGTVDRSAASALTSQSPGSAHYVVRVDPRLCPSPLCGGYWVSLANHARTRCHDGLLRPRCYVASAVGKGGAPSVNLADGALARARIASRGFDGLGRLGVLVVADAFAPAGRARSAGRFFRIVDTGIRCIRAPCFSQRAGQLNRALWTTVSGVDLTTSKATPTELARAEAELRTKRGLLAQGRIVAGDDGGRMLRATRFFLRSES
jgi:hypothetical protein